MSLIIKALKGSKRSIKDFDESHLIDIEVTMSDQYLPSSVIVFSLNEKAIQRDDEPLHKPIVTMGFQKPDGEISLDHWFNELVPESTPYPSGLKTIEFRENWGQYNSFTSMTIIYKLGRYFINIEDVRDPSNNCILIVEHSDRTYELIQKYPNALIFESSERVLDASVYYGNKNLAVITHYEGDTIPKIGKGFVFPYKESMTLFEATKLYLKGDKSFTIDKSLFDLNNDIPVDNTQIIRCIDLGDFHYFETEDKLVKFTTLPNASIEIIKVCLNEINNIADEADKKEIGLLFIKVLREACISETPDKTIVKDCISFLVNLKSNKT